MARAAAFAPIFAAIPSLAERIERRLPVTASHAEKDPQQKDCSRPERRGPGGASRIGAMAGRSLSAAPPEGRYMSWKKMSSSPITESPQTAVLIHGHPAR